MLRSIDNAYVHPDKTLMEAIYKGYLDELFGVINTCKEKGLLKEDKK